MPRLKDSTPRCGKHCRSTGKPCENAAGWRTDHPGEGACYMHGGKTPIKTGIDSKYQSRRRIKDLENEYAAVPNPLDLRPELNKARALFQDFIDRYDDWADGFERWTEWDREQFRAVVRDLKEATQTKDTQAVIAALQKFDQVIEDQPQRPRQFMDLTASCRVVDSIVKIVDKISAVKDRQQVPYSTVFDLQKKMAMVVHAELRQLLGDERGDRAAERIANRWRQIQLDM